MIWIIGSAGMLGTELVELCKSQGVDYVGSDRDVSILELEALQGFLSSLDEKGQKPDWIVNCAAYTAVDKAEDEPERCYSLNALGPQNIGRIASAFGVRVLHISTDYVFAGNGTRPYSEDDPVAPQSVYGKTKAEGERLLLDACPNAVIVRTAWLYGQYGPNFVATMIKLMNTRDSVGVVADQKGSPTWARDLAEAILTIVGTPHARAGIYHFTDEGEITWFDFAKAIYAQGRACGLIEHECEVRPLTTAEYPTKARRPAYSVLSKEKIRTTFGVQVPEWRDSLARFLEEEAQNQQSRNEQARRR
jgi:dTDP-4-dehydrorhamnose reductase